MRRTVAQRWEEINIVVARADAIVIDTLFHRNYNRSVKTIQENHARKLQFLRAQAAKEAGHILWPNKSFRDSLIANFTDVQFEEAELDILALGPKFAVYNNVPISDVVASVQQSLWKVPNGGDSLASNIARLIHKTHQKLKPNLSEIHMKAINSIKKKLRQNDIIVNSADKGEKTVIMKKDDYLNKMMAQLNNNELYEKQRKNCNAISRSHVIMSKKLAELNYPTSLLKSKEASHTSHAYGLLKIHKQGAPVRIIIPMVGTVTYEISKQLDLLLRPIVNHIPHRISSGDSLIYKLSALSDARDLFLGSLDVVALFPNVDIDLFLQQLPNLLDEYKQLWCGLDNPLSQLS
ncbi:MAG: hypothetical protein GY820_30825, partial [Gammaproteobacteria bacterium]|nr:hypothetical protein [Gammaproteobacteria bacterium]